MILDTDSFFDAQKKFLERLELAQTGDRAALEDLAEYADRFMRVARSDWHPAPHTVYQRAYRPRPRQ